MGPTQPLEEIVQEAERFLVGVRTAFQEKRYQELALVTRELLSAVSRINARAAVMAQLQAEGLV